MASTGSDYVLRVELEEFKKQMQEVTAQFKKVGDQVQKEGNRMDGALKKVGAAVGSYFAYQQIQQFAAKIVQVRSEIEKLQVSFRTLAGAEAGGKLFDEIKQFATTTPLLMKDLASAAQTMLGFGIAADKIIPNLKAIGDISMGDSQRLQSLSLAFSQMTATGKLMGQDLLQMINAGFNPLEEISRKTGKSIGELKDEMSKGAISADMVRDAFISATSEGGKFYGMLEAQSKTIAGAYSNLEGAIDDAFNKMGETAQPIIISTIEGLTEVAKNYEIVGKVVLTAVEAIGAYKAAELASIAITNAHTIAIELQTAAQMALNAAMALNPYVAATMAVIALAAAIYTWTDRTTAQERAEKSLQERNEALANTLDDRRKAAEKLLAVVVDETKSDTERAEALQQLKETEGAVFESYDTYIELTNARTQAQKDLNDAIRAEMDLRRLENYNDDKTIYEAWKRRDTNEGRQRIMEVYRKNGGKGNEHNALRWAMEYMGGSEEAIKKRINLQDAERSKGAQSSYLASIQSMDIKTMREQQTEMKRLLKLAKDQDRRYVDINGTLISREQLLERITKLQERQDSQSKKSNPYQDAVKAYKDAKTELDKLYAKAKTSLTLEERNNLDKEIKEKEAALKGAKEKLESYGWSDKKKQKKDDFDIAQTKSRQEKEEIRQERDLQLAIERAKVDAMDEGHNKTMQQIDLNYEAEMNRINDWYDDLIEQRIKNEEELWKKDPKNKDKTFKPDASLLQHTEEDNRLLFQQMENAVAIRENAAKKAQKAEEEAMRNYLREFGTYEEKRKAIAEEYAEKIAKAQTEGERLTLQAQQEGTLQKLDEQFGRSAQALADLFGDASKKSTAELQKIIDKYEQLAELMQGKKTSSDLVAGGLWSEKEVSQAVGKINKGDLNAKDLNDIIKSLKDIVKERNPFQSIEDAFERIRNASRDGKKDFKELGSGIKEASDAVEAYLLPNLNQIGDAITSIFGDGAGSVMSDITSGVSGALNIGKGVGQAMSGDILGGVSGIMGGIASIFSIFGGTGNAEEMIDAANAAAEALENLSWVANEYAKDMQNATSVEDIRGNYNMLKQNYNEQMVQQQRILQDYAWIYRRGVFVKDKDMLDRQIMKQDVWRQVVAIMGDRNISSYTAEDWYDLRKNHTGVYSALQAAMTKLGEQNDWEEYAEQINGAADAMADLVANREKLDKMLKEELTGITFETFRDNFVSVLSDMSSTTKDFCKTFQEQINKIAFKRLSEKMSRQLEQYYDTLSAYAESDGGISAWEQASLQGMRDALIKQALDQRKILEEAGLIENADSVGATATSRSIGNIREDQADVMNGRLTYIQTVTTSIQQHLAEQNEIVRGQKSILDSYQDLMFDSNQRLREIAENTRKLHGIEQTLQDIKNNTSRL